MSQTFLIGFVGKFYDVYLIKDSLQWQGKCERYKQILNQAPVFGDLS